MNAITLMLGAAFLWSLYPAIIALSDAQIGAPLFVILIHISSGLSAALFAFLSIKQKAAVWHNLKYYTKSLDMDEWLYLLLIGIVSTLYNFCFVVAMDSTSKVGTAVIIEAWPLIAMFLAPLLITKTWKKVRFTDYIAGFIALIGVGLIMLGDQVDITMMLTDFHAYSQTEDYDSIIGIIIALIGSFCLALSIVLSGQVSNKISEIVLQEDEYTTTCAYIGEAVRRIVALLPSLLLLFAFKDEWNISAEGFGLAVFAGIFIFNIGSMAVTLALLKSPSSTINMLYYISPILAIGWLYLIGQADLTVMIIFGGALVILANLLVLGKNKKPKEIA